MTFIVKDWTRKKYLEPELNIRFYIPGAVELIFISCISENDK